MVHRFMSHGLAALVVATTLVWATGCNGDDDDECFHCCECSNDGSPLVYRPGSTDDCMSCGDQCQALADREFLGQEFDNAKDIHCPD